MIENVTSFSQLINEYGPLIVILAVFLTLFIILIAYIVKSNKDNQEMTKQLIIKMIGDKFPQNPELSERKHYDERKIVDIFMELNKALKTVCDYTMKQTHSDRTAIYVFHNGAHSSHGLPFFKLTCVSETISKNSNANIKIAEHSSVPLTLYESIVTNLYNNSEYRIKTDETEDPGEIIFLRNTKIKDCFFIPIYDDDNNMMGFTFNGYNTSDDSRDLEKEKENLIDLAMMAKPVIEYSKFQEYQSKED